MAVKRTLPEIPEWLEFCREYQGDIVRFATEVCGYKLSRQQIRLLRSVARSRSRASVASGHGTGKTKSLSIICLWHLLCHPHSVMLVTANDMDQLKATLWKEIGITLEKIRQGVFGWIADQVFVGADLHCHIVGFADTWFVESKTANAKTANKMAGRHGEWFMVVVDEGSTVPDEVFSTLLGALTEEHNRMLVTSQYTRLSGFFHRTQTELCADNGGEWDAMTFSSMDSIWVSDQALKELWDSLDDDERRVRIFGLPPEDSSKFMMNLKAANSMYKRGRIIRDDEAYGWGISSDVALGEGLRDKSSILVARVIGYGDTGPDARRVEIVEIPLFTNNVRANSLPGHIIDAGDTFSNASFVVDKGGIGGSICQNLEDKGVMLTSVVWGQPCWRKSNSERFVNKRAQASYSAARAAKEGRLSILCSEHKRAMITQASGIPKDHSANYRLKIPEKGSPAWEGRGSPDLWDAVCYFFIEDFNYIPAGHDSFTGESAVGSAVAAASDMFSDVA
jgi:hypothetical protein